MPRRKWDKHAIKAEVHRRGATLKGIAVAAGLEESATRVALLRRLPSGERALSDFLGVPVPELFPERYPSRPSSSAGRYESESRKDRAA